MAGEEHLSRPEVPASASYPAWHPNHCGLSFLHCEEVEVRGNRLDGAFEGREIRVEGGRPETVRTTDW